MPDGYNPANFPESFKDPAYDQADQAASAAVGIPSGMLSAIRTKGEKSNASQISNAGAASVYQITPTTRQAIINQTGVDPYLNPQTAAYGAAYLLKQSMDRSGGNPVQAVAEYVGGTDQSAWGPRTMAYVKRVTGFTPSSYQQGSTPNPFQVQPLPDVGSAPGAIAQTPSMQPQGSNPYAVQPLPNIGNAPGSMQSGPSALQQAYQAYQSGKMDPQDSARFEQDVQAGRIVLPAGMDVKAPQAAPADNLQVAPMAPQQAIDAYNAGQMSPADMKQFEQDTGNGSLGLPPGITLTPPQPGAGRTAGVAARGYLEGLGQGVGGLIDRAKGVIDAPMNAVNAIAQGQGPLNVVDSALGTHLAPQPAQAAPLAGAPNAAAQIPSMEQGAEIAANKLGLPVAQTPGEKIVQEGARGAGLMTQPFPGASLRALPAMVAAGTAGGAVGEQVHQQTGSAALGMAANLLTTALSPLAASRVMSALVGEIGARDAAAGVGARAEPTMQAPAQEAPTAQGAAPKLGAEPAQPQGQRPTGFSFDANGNPVASTPAQPSAPLGTQPNPGTPEVTNPQVSELQREKEGLLPVAANAPEKGDTAIQDQMAALAGRTFDTVQDRTRALQAQGMKFGDARTLAQKQIEGEMGAYQDQLGSLQNQMSAAQEGSRAAQRVQDIDAQLADLAATVPAQRTAISEAVNRAVQERPAAPAPSVSPSSTATAAPEAATAAEAPAEAAAPESAASLNPTASPVTAAARDFMAPSELAAQTRTAVGAGSAPFGLGRSTAQQVLAEQGAPDAETLAAAKRLGIEDNLQPDHLTSNQAYRELAQAIKSTPGSLARANEMQGLEQVGQRAAQVIEDAGGTRDLSELSSQVRNQMMSTQQQLDQKAEALYNGLKEDVPPKMPAAADQVLGFIKQRADELGGAQNLSPMERQIMAKLSPKEQPIIINGQKVDPATIGMKPQFQQPSYALLDDVRKDIGNGLRNAGVFKDEDIGLKKKLYALTSEDQRAALANSGIPNALERFDTARATVQMRKSVEDDLTSLYGKQLGDSLVGKLGTAMAALPNGNEAQFVKLIKSIPQSMRQQVTASGLGYAFGKATKNGELNFKTFADWMDGLKKNSAAFSAVMGNLPAETRQQLLDLAKVSRGVASATRENITTGRIMAAREELNARADGMLSKVMDTARRAAVSRVGSTISAAASAHVGGPLGAGLSHALMSSLSKGKPDVMKAADELITSPEFQALAKGSANPQQIKAAANSPTFRRFYNLARTATAANDPVARESWLRGVVNATGQQLAESSSNKNR